MVAPSNHLDPREEEKNLTSRPYHVILSCNNKEVMMKSADELIQTAIDEGHSFLVLEPRELFAPAVMEMHPELNRLVYKVDILLACLADAYDWEPLGCLEWFEYNIMSLSLMKGGPIFYDEFNEDYLTIDV
jgi:hypothetical protein